MPRRARRQFANEYLPLVLRSIGILVLAHTIGHADVVRLIAVLILAKASAFSWISSIPLLRARRGAEPQVWTKSLKSSIIVEAACIAWSLFVLALLVALLHLLNAVTARDTLAVLALGSPARRLLVFSRAARPRMAYRMYSAIGFVSAIGVGTYLGQQQLSSFAALLALSQWLAAMGALPGGNRVNPARANPTAFSWHDVLSRSDASARRKLAYSIRSIVLSPLAGPFASFANRALRNSNAAQLGERLLNQGRIRRTGLIAFTVFALSVMFHRLYHEPSSLLVMSGSFRILSIVAQMHLLGRLIGNAERPHPPGDIPKSL